MAEKNLSITLLLDFYGEILTRKQREVMELYYNDDLSLAEIAAQADITRQGVRDCIKRGEATLSEMEEKLRLAAGFQQKRKTLDGIRAAADEIDRINSRFCSSEKISKLAEKIKIDADSLYD